MSTRPDKQTRWIPLYTSLAFLLKNPRLLTWSVLLIILTGGLTWIGYLESITLVDSWVGNFFQHPPQTSGIWGWLLGSGWLLLKYLFLAISRVVAFYLAFLLAYTLTTPGYVFLSSATEKKYLGGTLDSESGNRLANIITDLIEGGKIAALGLLVTLLALALNFIPLAGQGLVFLLYTFYSALMFVDYPASNRRWSLGQKTAWLNKHKTRAIRLGLLPALISFIPIINVLFMAFLFPLFTVHTTLNFVAQEDGK